MTEPTAAKPGEPCWIDLLSSDTDVATTFYGDVFGWTAETAGPGVRRLHQLLQGRHARRRLHEQRPGHDGGMPDAWAIYLASDDAQATVDAAVANGGGVMLAPMEIPAIGYMAYVTDPSGAAVGLFQATGDMTFGYDGVASTATPTWFELFTKDFAADRRRSTRRCSAGRRRSWATRDEFRYPTLVDGERAKAGVMDASAASSGRGRPGALVGVLPRGRRRRHARQDHSSTAARSPTPAEDTPYGRLAALTDPTGANFSLLQPLG